MLADMPILPVIWFLVIGFAVAMYITLDGFSLGIGILFPFARDENQKSLMMGSVMPVWDGNQTWMILAGAGLYGAFPVVYATILPALYLPLILMLLALIFRGIAFEFRGKSERYRHMFDLAFSGGSLVATFAQGVVLGGIVHGLHVSDYQFAGAAFDWLTPFSLFTGVALVLGYASLGAGWIVVKTEGDTQRLGYGCLRPLTLALLVAMAIISAWTPLSNGAIAERWFSTPNVFYLSIVPVLVVLLAVNIFFDIAARREKLIFAKLVLLFMLGLIGLVISFFPYVVPPSITLWDAASSPSSQRFLIVGYAVILPLVLIYTAYSYHVFRGKVRPGNLHHY